MTQLSQSAVTGLLQLQSAGQSPVYMSGDQGGNELAQAGLIQVNPNEKDPNNLNAYRVFLTQQGQEYLNSMNQTAPQAAPAAPVANPNQAMPQAPYSPPAQQAQPQDGGKPSFNLRNDVGVPKVQRGNASNLTPRESIYPFDKMEVGQSFHIPATAEDPEPWKKMGSNVSAANKRSQVPVEPVEYKTVTRKKMRKDENGNPVLDENGKRIYDEHQESQQKMRQTKKFIARRVSGSGDQPDPEGDGVRVFRVPVDAS